MYVVTPHFRKYKISSLDSSFAGSVTISGLPTYSYFLGFTTATKVQLELYLTLFLFLLLLALTIVTAGVVATTNLSSNFPVSIEYRDDKDTYYTSSGFFSLAGGATISLNDISSSETLTLLNISYLDASYPVFTVDFPSYQFASGFLALDGTNVATLKNSTQQ